METAEDKYITVAYKLYTTEDGKRGLVEKTTAEHPFQFTPGLGTTFGASESQITNLNKGDKFGFTIPLVEAYGEHDEGHVIDLPKNIFEADGKLNSEYIYPRNIIPLVNSEGQRLNGSVVEVKADAMVMDMNHPLAGEDLTLVGEVVESRPTINEEIQGTIKMMTGEGGCSCGSCGDGHDNDCGDSCGDSCDCGHCH